MDDILKRRLVGALVVLGIALVLSLLLPKPGEEPLLDSGTQRVTIDLSQPEVTPASPPAIESALPPVIAAPQPATAAGDMEIAEGAAQTAEPQVDTPADETVAAEPGAPAPEPEKKLMVEAANQPHAAVPKPSAAPATPKPAASAAGAKTAQTPKPSAPGLKLAEKITPPPAAKPPPTAPALPASARAAKTPLWFVQVGSFTEIGNARTALDQLKPAKGVISPADTPKGTLYRVRLGPYASKEKAAADRDHFAPKASLVED